MSEPSNPDASTSNDDVETTSDRRRFLTGGAAAAAVAGAAVIAGAEPAGAANGDTLKIGQGNTGTSMTVLTGSTIKVQPSGSTSLPGDAGLWGISKATGDVGVRGDWTGTSGSGTGVRGTTQKGTGVIGEASDAGGIGVAASSPSGAALFLDNTAVAIPPTSGSTSWLAGSLVQKNGDLWYCYQSGTGAASKWRQISAEPAAPPSGGGATQPEFYPLDSPVRVYDSRAGKAPTTTVAKGALAGGTERVIDVTEAGSIPTAVTSVVGNLTIVNTALGSSSAGFLAVYPNGIPFPGTSTINWTSNGAIIANAFNVSVASRKLRVRNGSATTSTDFLIDITGYYR